MVNQKNSSQKKAVSKGALPDVSSRLAVIVLGMHRSGTSALTGVLARLGCALPVTEMPKTASNPSGFYESNEVYVLNNTMLDLAGIDWQDWQPFRANWKRSQHTAELVRRAADIFENEFGSAPLLIMKDPRLCRLFPLWHQALTMVDCDVAIVHTHRNPLEVAQSLEARNKLPISTGLMIWLRYVLDAEAGTRGLRRSFTSYSRLLKNWQREVNGIEIELDLTFPRRSLQSAADVDSFLSSDLKHHRVDVDDIAESGMISPWVRDTFNIMERWAKRGERAADHATLDRINVAFSDTARIYGPIIRQFQMNPALEEAARLKPKLKTLRCEIETLRTQYEKATVDADSTLETVRTELKNIQEELRVANGELETVHDVLNVTQDKLAMSTAERETLRQKVKKQRESTEREIKVANERIIAERAQQDRLRIALENRVAALKVELEQADALHHKFETISVEYKVTKEELSSTQSALAQRQHESEEAYGEIRAFEQVVEDLRAKCDVARATPVPEQTNLIASLEKRLRARDEEIKVYLEEKSSLTGQINVRYQELSQMAQLIKSLEDRNAQTEETSRAENLQMHESMTLEIEDMRRLVSEQTHEKEVVLDAIAQVTAEREHFRHEFERVKVSTSWRITGPLRHVISMIRG